ncbi:DUF3626 domain-containing protein [Actinocatenispora sera]|uniref:DUF3626 domain-containing protein n=1 Tax=Actinocatenispora sera TaxID=390989 RepID=A0A810L559_9ACTN|nr:hypothetical protein Asera_44750 [Actinocatenispora sera]
MTAGAALDDFARRALRLVAARAAGPPLAAGVAVTVHFHPDRLVAGDTVLAGLARSGRYLSQFVTGVSNGGLSAYRGGARWGWESRLFGGAYDAAPPDARPVYGAVMTPARVVGAAPRFGSSFLRLAPETLERTTFCYPDSVFEPDEVGTARCMSLLARAEADDLELLDSYVEAHVHGGVRLDRDVAALVLDRCYRDTEVARLAATLPCPVEWHPGFRLGVDELRRHPDYRGADAVELGAEIAVDGALDPAVLGAAAATGRYDPQQLKRVWHLVARFGAPDRTAG